MHSIFPSTSCVLQSAPCHDIAEYGTVCMHPEPITWSDKILGLFTRQPAACHQGILQCIPHEARCLQVLAVAGDTVNKAAESATTPQVPKNFVKPKQITSYGQYLKYAGQAAGILPIQPEADSPSGAPGPAAGTATTFHSLASHIYSLTSSPPSHVGLSLAESD